MSTYTATIRCVTAGLAMMIDFQPLSAAAEPHGWTYRDDSQVRFKSVEAQLQSRDGRAILAINCSISGDHTVSIQYRPSNRMGLSMAPIVLDWMPSDGRVLSSKIVWEPDRAGAFARDGVDDRNASDVARAIEQRAGTLSITAADRWGDVVETLYDNVNNREIVGRVLAQCPWNPPVKTD